MKGLDWIYGVYKGLTHRHYTLFISQPYEIFGYMNYILINSCFGNLANLKAFIAQFVCIAGYREIWKYEFYHKVTPEWI